MLRNFRRDGHNWKKKKDGKTVKEAHEHLKVSFQILSIFWELYLDTMSFCSSIRLTFFFSYFDLLVLS